MTPSVKLRTAEALFPVLSLFHEIHGELLEDVTQVLSDASLTEIRFHTRSKSLLIRAMADDDTVDLSLVHSGHAESGEVVSQLQPWSGIVGRPIGWGWVAVNQQGYTDGVLLSFGGVVPELGIFVAASALEFKRFF